MLRKIFFLLLLGIGISCHAPLFAQSLFDAETPLSLVLEANLTAVQQDRGSNPEYHKAKLRYVTETGDTATAKLKIKARGAYRLDPYICDFPPLRFNFDKDDDLPAPFDGQNKLKVVTHCQEEQFIFREYYLYLLYRKFTERSFRVRLAQITYVDTEGREPTETKWAFFIESEEDMAARHDATPLEEDIVLQPEEVDRDHLTLCHMFNYMIANRDFRVSEYQNLKIITNGNKKPVVVPYDFDWSGMVNASYTKRKGDHKPTYKSRQIFRPLCRTQEEYAGLIAQFQAMRDEIEEMYETSPYLTKEVKKESLGYYSDFYKLIRKKSTMRDMFLSGCNP